MKKKKMKKIMNEIIKKNCIVCRETYIHITHTHNSGDELQLKK